MGELLRDVGSWAATGTALRVLAGLAILVAGLIVARLAGAAVRRLVQGRATAQQAMVAQRVAFYGILGLTLVSALNQLGFDLSILLGAAGILTVALGFASQTSASNLISGLFLLGERSFVVGDTIRVGSTVGEVVSLDLLSIELRTADNVAVRLPNEMLLKMEIANLTRYPIRRVDVAVSVDQREDLVRVDALLRQVVAANPGCLDEPRAQVNILGFGPSSVDLQLCVWARREAVLEVGNQVRLAIHQAFATEGIDLPIPQRLVHTAGQPAGPAAGPTRPV